LGANGSFCILYDYYGKSIKTNPWKISYSKTSIPAHFTNSLSIWKAISDIEKGKLDPNTFPPIRVLKKDDKLVTLDNRRLFVFQNAGLQNIATIILDKPSKQIKVSSSVKVSQCYISDCSECSYGFSPPDYRGCDSLKKETWSRSWNWLHFLKTSPPPSVLLFQESSA